MVTSCKVAKVVLAGGLNTRAGGTVAALHAPPKNICPLSTHIITQPPGAPLWIMTSPQTDGPIRKTVEGLTPQLLPLEGIDIDIRTFMQPTCGGHGDVFEALATSGLLEEFNPEFLMICNVTNTGATVPNPYVFGWWRAYQPSGNIAFEVLGEGYFPHEGGGRVGGANHRKGVSEIFEEGQPTGVGFTSHGTINTNTVHVRTSYIPEILKGEWTYITNRNGDLERPLSSLTHHHECAFVSVPPFRYTNTARLTP